MMIRINLVTEKKKKKKKKKAQGPSNIKAFLIAANAVAFLVSGGTAYYFNGQVSVLKSATEANKKTLASLNKKADELKTQEEMKKELQRRGTLIETLTKDQAVPVKVLDGISNLLPDGVWIETFAVNGISISMSGSAFSNNDIVAYIENLKKNFDEVYLDETVQSVFEKTAIYRFKMRCNVRK